MPSFELFTLWQKSLDGFKQPQLKMFCLASLGTWIRGLRTTLRLFWWFIGATLLISLWHAKTIQLHDNWLASLVPEMLKDTFSTILGFVLIACMRPSLETKNLSYFCKHYGAFFATLCILPEAIDYILFFPAATIFILFFFDSEERLPNLIPSFLQTGRLYVFFLPSIAVVTAVAFLLQKLGDLLCGGIDILASMAIQKAPTTIFFLSIISKEIIFWLIFSCILAVLTVLYVTFKHKHFNVLFNEQGLSS